MVERHAGPLPAPQTLKAYNDIVPGAAESIIESFLEQGKHRREMERKNYELDNKYLGASIDDSERGSWFAFILCALALFIGAYVAVNGAQWAGGAISVTGLGGLVYAFKSGISLSLKSQPIAKQAPETSESPSQSDQEIES